MDAIIDLRKKAPDNSYKFYFRDSKVILVDVKENDIEGPTFQFRLQDTKTKEILDNLDVYVTPGDHRWLKAVK